jgi:hypothetical protein
MLSYISICEKRVKKEKKELPYVVAATASEAIKML